MSIENLKTIEDLANFIVGNQNIAFTVLCNKKEKYAFIQTTLAKFSYLLCSRNSKGIIFRYLQKITNYPRQQPTRLVKRYKENGNIKWYPCRHNSFKKQYNKQVIILLAEMDRR